MEDGARRARSLWRGGNNRVGWLLPPRVDACGLVAGQMLHGRHNVLEVKIKNMHKTDHVCDT